MINHVRIELLPVRVKARIGFHEATADKVVPLVSFRLELFPELVSLLFAHCVVLVLATIKLLGFVPFRFSFSLGAHVKHSDGLVDHVELNFLIEGTVSGEGRQAVDLNQPRLYFVIDEDIDSQDFKAHGVFEIVWLQASKGMAKLRLGTNQSFHCNVVNLFPKGLGSDLWILFSVLYVFEYTRYRPFMAGVIFS